MATQREYEKMRADYEKNVLGEDENVTHMGRIGHVTAAIGTRHTAKNCK